LEKSGNDKIDLLKSLVEANNNLSVRKSQNTNMHRCMWFSKQNVI